MKEQNIKTGKLNEDLSKLKRLSNECNNEIKIVNEHLKNLILVFKQKNGENQRLKQRINDIKFRIQKGELVSKFSIEKQNNENIIQNNNINEKENESDNEENENSEDDSKKDIDDSNLDINNNENSNIEN
jgi:hypothetical protein